MNSENGVEESMSEEENSEEMDVNEEEEENENDKDAKKPKKVYLPGDPLAENEVLECDKSAYEMLHSAQTGVPCLSFDIIQNPWHPPSGDFPITAYLVAGTQAPETHANSIIVMQMSNMHKMEDDEDSEESSDSEDEEDSKSPRLKSTFINHLGCINRVRSLVHDEVILAASWSELGRVMLWDITGNVKATASGTKEGLASTPLFSFKGHQSEGYGLDWSPTKKGVLASGDCKRGIHIWHPSEGSSWQVDQRPLMGHTDSVEDLQWSPNESNVLASCSVDKSIRIWDIRAAANKANKLTVENAHEMDVNVISWNRNEPFIVSGGDDGVLRIWDLRQFMTGRSVASFKHHTQPVTTVEWHATDPTVFASGGADNQIALWDIAVERDTENCADDVENLPSQLLFIHQGQTDIKELHWHPQFPGVVISTALDGFNIFKTISV
ncbi:hypothetical protein R5R35_008628 [Gryllus longicercus]|uniref:Glutamate-rich WD repeat-containing protein 1 n=1 Tax=Gryllus longicercus TaxID=2509291 RepID=A0AAN9VS65_9ORTH